MTEFIKNDESRKILKERNPRKNFDETRFIAEIVLFFCERSLDEVRIAKRNEEMTAVCNLYSMINLTELRDIAGFNCNFGLIDEYRDIILEKTEASLHMMGIQTSSTYKHNPYMVCAFTADCVGMDADELDRLGNGFTTDKEFKKVSILILFVFFINVVYNAAFIILSARAVKLPSFMYSGWPQLILVVSTISVTVAAIAYYFRRCIAAAATEWKVRRRFCRSTEEKTDRKAA